jgi:hypothetical protein
MEKADGSLGKDNSFVVFVLARGDAQIPIHGLAQISTI